MREILRRQESSKQQPAAFCADPADFICAQVDIGTKIVMSKIIDLLRLLQRLDAVSIILFDRIEYMIPPLIVD